MALKRIALGAATLSAARLFQLASSFVAIPFLARILTPTDFGLAALAMSLVMFFTLIGDAGLGRSLVRVDAEDHEAWSSAFWVIVLLTCVLGLLILALAWPAASFFDEPRLAPIMMTLALSPVLMGLADIPAASLLQREKFQWLAGAEFAAAMGGIVVALIVAFNGGGAWALVWQHLTQRVIKGIVIFWASKLRPRLVLNFKRITEHTRFMIDTTAWSATLFVSRQADTLIVGKFLGAATLGLYNIAVRVMQLPVSIIGGSLFSVIYPRLVAVREDNPALRQLVLFATLAQAVFVFPPIAAVAAASEAFFTVLLSDRWQASASIFTLLAGAAAIQTIVAINGSLLQAINRTGARLRLSVEYAILLASVALVTAQFGIHAVAAGCTLASLAYLPRLLHLYLGPIECSVMDFLRILLAPTMVSLLIFAGHRTAVSMIDLGPWAELGLAVGETLIGYALLAGLLRGDAMRRLREVRAILASTPKAEGDAPA